MAQAVRLVVAQSLLLFYASSPVAAYLLPPEQEKQMLAENQRGLELYNDNKFLEAAQAFANAEKIGRGQPFLLKNLAKSYYQARKARANDYFSELLRCEEPMDVETWNFAVRSFAAEYQWESVSQAARKAAQEHPDEKGFVAWRAAAAYASGQSFEDVYEWWKENNPGKGQIVYFDEVADAISIAARRFDDAGGHYRPIQNWALLYRFQSDCKKHCYFSNDKSRPDPDVLYRIAQLSSDVKLKLKPSAAAVVEALKAQELADTDDPDRWRKADELYQTAIVDSPWWADAHFNHAVASFSASEDNIRSAIISLKIFLAFKTSDEQADLARRLLNEWIKASH